MTDPEFFKYLQRNVQCPHDVPSAFHLQNGGLSFIVLNRDSPWKPRDNTSRHGCQNIIQATWWLPLEKPAEDQFKQNQGDEKWSCLEWRFKERDAILLALKSSTFFDQSSDILYGRGILAGDDLHLYYRIISKPMNREIQLFQIYTKDMLKTYHAIRK